MGKGVIESEMDLVVLSWHQTVRFLTITVCLIMLQQVLETVFYKIVGSDGNRRKLEGRIVLQC